MKRQESKKGYRMRGQKDNKTVAQWSPRTEKAIDEMLLQEALRGAFGKVKPETIEKLKRNVAQHKKV
jgi:hypothetical protein